MAAGELRGASRPRETNDAPYEGSAGRTRLRPIHLPLPSGEVRTIQVYDVVNVGTHPRLRDAALKGALHRLETGEELAIAFVFHDPAARKLALVVPEVLRHEELRLRAELLADIARDREHPVPSYVREATAVIGPSELARYLERPPAEQLRSRDAQLAEREAALASHESSLAEREAELEAQRGAFSQRESRLKARAEEVTRREDEQRAFAEELEAARADLAVREQELEVRFERLRARESELEARAADARGPEPSEALVMSEELEEVHELERLATSPGDELLPGDVTELADAVELIDDASSPTLGGLADAVELIDDASSPTLGGLADAVELIDDASSPSLADAVELIDDASSPSLADAVELLEDDVEEHVEELEELEELEDVEPIDDVTGIHAGLVEAEPAPSREATRRSEPPSARAPIAIPASELPPPRGSVAPPRGFLEETGPSLSATMEGGGVRLFARLPAGASAQFDEESAPELLVQLTFVEERPVVVLSLARGETVLRMGLDPRAASDRAILEALRRRFAARLAVFASDGAHLRSFEVTAPREVNVASILDRVARVRGAAAIDGREAIGKALAVPPPIAGGDHPFYDEGPLSTAADVAAALERLLEWSEPDKLDHALLVLSIPSDRIDGAVRRASSAAAEHGLALGDALLERAISLGVAPDAPTWVARAIEAFARTSAQEDRGGLSAQRAAENWEQLLRLAADAEVGIDTETHDLAWRTIREVRGDGEGPVIDPAKLPEMGAPELVLLLEHPRHRRDAALELCRRNDPEFAETLAKAVRKMPRAEVVRVAPRIVELGDEAGDALIDGLGARKTFVRQAFALALGQLELRRAVVPLVHLLSNEESEVWREVARVVGAFGNASLRNVTRLLRAPKGKEERYAWALAHLANHGCLEAVEKLTRESHAGAAAIAREALSLRERARTIDEQVRGAAPLIGDDPILAFSRRFYQELEGKAPADDLEEGPVGLS